jgi:hypothetical protein
VAHSAAVNQPEHILRTLDRYLTRPTRIIIYGRAALALGYENSPVRFHATMDVDAILPESSMAAIEADDVFWTAIEKTNADLEANGLYMTHLFCDSQVILRNTWLEHIVSIALPALRFLQLFRPATEDLILTKMMRVDPQDRDDIGFLIAHLSLDSANAESLIQEAQVPAIPEIEEAFRLNADWLRNELHRR